jgi:hypothetical protein
LAHRLYIPNIVGLSCGVIYFIITSFALSRAVAKHIGLSATRRETLSAYVASAAQTASVQRRVYRFFQFVRLDGAHLARVVVELLGLSGKPRVLAIDRSN